MSRYKKITETVKNHITQKEVNIENKEKQHKWSRPTRARVHN